MAIPRRGVSNIRTRSGTVDQADIAFKTYLKMSCLEMERARRSKERESAMQRVKLIDARFQEIDAEKDDLLKSQGERNGERSNGKPIDARPNPAPSKKAAGFKLRY